MTKRHTERVMHSSARSEWRTPPALFVALDKEFHFDVDVAADRDNHLCDTWYGPGADAYGRPTDALDVNWGRRCYFMNPPYAKAEKRPIDPWVAQAWQTSYQMGGIVVGVLPFSPQTEWFRTYVMGMTDPFHAAAELRMLPHRVTFNRPDGTPADNAPGNTVIVIWRPNPGYVGPWQPAVRYWSYR